MKRAVLPLLAVVLLAAAGFYLLRHAPRHPSLVAQWLPNTTILLEEMPDIHRTRDRWPQTALAQILAEPEVQAFLQRPRTEVPDRAGIDQRHAQFNSIDPVHFFVAVTDWNGSGVPTTVLGLDYSGSHKDLDSLVGDLRKKVQETWPDGKSDIEQYGAGDVETFTTPSFTAALAYRRSWLFISTDVAVLKATLDRFEGHGDPNSLANLPEFKASLAHSPTAPDNFFFIRPALLADQVSGLALMLNPTLDPHNSDGLKRIASMSVALKLDGEAMRDATYILKASGTDDDAPAQPPLARDSLKLSTAYTVIATSSRVQNLGGAQLPDPKSDPSGILDTIDSYLQAFTAQGLGTEQLAQAFGPESGFVIDWSGLSMVPAPLFMMDVRDAALARKFLDTLISMPMVGGVQFSKQDMDGVSYYSLPATGFGIVPIQLTLGLTGKCLIAAPTMEAVKQAAGRWDQTGARLDGTEQYKKAVSMVQEPTNSFSYVDTKALFEHMYGLFQSVASMGFIPYLSNYVDIGKMPATATISHHLIPIVTSGSETKEGLLIESAGPVTMGQAIAAGGAVFAVAAIPMAEAQLKGQSVPFPGVSFFGHRPSNPIQNPFAPPLLPGGYGNPLPSLPSPSPASGMPSASPSAGSP